MESSKSTNPVLARVLEDIKNAQNSHSATTAHNVYTSGVFEDVANKEANPVLARVLEDIKNAQNSHSATTAHNVYTSGVFEDVAPEGDLKKD
jgi:hypothetical protein